jgi:hypothetical protein
MGVKASYGMGLKLGCAAIFGSKGIWSEYLFASKRKKTGFICLFRIKANQRILHAKRIKTEANIPSYGNILLISHQSEYLKQNEANIFNKNRILIEALDL